MTEGDLGAGEAHLLAAALRAYTATGVRYRGGWGTTLESAVIIEGAPTESIHTNSVHRFLEFTLGERGADWKLDRACLCVWRGGRYDAMEVLLAGGSKATVFFLVDGGPVDWDIDNQTLACFVTGGTVRGEAERRSPEGQPMSTSSISINPALWEDQSPLSLEYVLEHLLQHSSQTHFLAGDELL